MFETDDESVNTGEVAEPQETESDNEDEFFVDDDIDSETESDESENNQEAAEPDDSEEDSDKPKSTPKPKQDNTENAKYAAARREAEKQARELTERQNNFAKSYGYSSFEEMEAATKAQKYVEQGYDEEVAKKLVQIDNYEKDLQQKLNSARISEEKAKFKDVPYFKELESEIDSILQQNSALPVELVFDVVKGRNMDKLLETKTKAAAQKALNNINSKNHIKADGKGVDIDTTTIDESEWNFYKGLNPKAKKEDYIKFKKSIK